jgi:hypothetical protein
MSDSIVEEVHESRRRILEQCDGDLDRLIARLKEGDRGHPERLVTLEQVQKRARLPKATRSQDDGIHGQRG